MARRPKTSRETPPSAVPEIAPSIGPAWRRHRIPLLALWGLALLAYANSFRAGLVFDNRIAIAQDARIRQASSENVRLILTEDYWYKSSTSSLYRPLTTLSYLFNYAVLGNGASPAGYHWFNFAVHAANIALVYLLGWLLLAEFWPAFAMAALWAVHPILTESVTNIVGRSDLLAAFGVLAGLLCYARSVTATGRRAVRWQLALAAVTAVGVFSKESGVVALAAVFLYDVVFCPGAARSSRVRGYLAVGLPVAAYLLARGLVLSHLAAADLPFTDNPLVGAGFWTARLTAVKVLGKYLWLLLWPAHLSGDYSYNQIPILTWRLDRWEDWKMVVALVSSLAVAALAAACWRRSKPVFFFIAFFFATLAPTANLAILIGTIMAERFLYLPSVGFAGCLVWLAWSGYRQRPGVRVVAPAAWAIVCLGFSVRTFARNADWLDERSFWTSAVQSSPESYKAHQHLASVLVAAQGGAPDEARREMERSVAILSVLPDEQKVPTVYALAGFCYRSKGDALGQGAGAPWYQKSLDVLLEGQRADQDWYAELSRRNSRDGKMVALAGWTPLYLELGRTYRSLGNFRKSLEAISYGRGINPQTAFFEEMAATYRALGDPMQAAVSLLEGVTMGSQDQARLAAEVVDLYRQAAPGSCALSGGALNFNCPLVRGHLCAAAQNVAELYRQMHREGDAVATVRGAAASLGCPADTIR